MSTAIIRGTLAPLLQRETWDFDPTRGYVHDLEYRGASQIQMLALQQSYVLNGAACRLTYEQGDSATLSIDDATYSYTIDSWEIVGNEEARDALTHPNLTNGILALGAYNPSAVITAMRNDLENQNPPHTIPGGSSPGVFDVGGDLSLFAGTIVERFYNYQCNGQTEYRRQQYVLRHKTNVPCRWTVNVADFGIDQIYTTAKLLTEVQNTALWVFPLPPRLAYKISQIPVPTAITNYLWGWLKSASTETTAAHNRVDITTEYTLENWSTDYYAPF